MGHGKMKAQIVLTWLWTVLVAAGSDGLQDLCVRVCSGDGVLI
jgi:hypothetical protein